MTSAVLSDTGSPHLTSPLPDARGPISAAVLDALVHPARPSCPALVETACGDAIATADPYGEDLQLALYLGYEPHYRGFRDVDPGWEWQPDLLRLRAALEQAFLTTLAAQLDAPLPTAWPKQGGPTVSAADLAAEFAGLSTEPKDGAGVSYHLRDKGSWWQLREYWAHRSLYQLKEADPHAFAIPRLLGQAKASLVGLEFDEFGAGHGDRVHSGWFANLMAEAGMDATYGAYLDIVPATTLATVNMISMFALHRALRGCCVGQLAVAELSVPPAARRLTQALERLGGGPAAMLFYTEHIEADAVHEQVMRGDVVGDLVAREPDLAADVLFGMRAAGHLERRFADALLSAWGEGRSSLRLPLPADPDPTR
jgi:hypothetical protein